MYEQSGELILFATPIALSVTSLGMAHWFPWHNGTKPLRRTTAYAIGTAIVVGYPVVAMLLCASWGWRLGELFWALLLLCNVAISGATVQVAYWVDDRKALGGEVHHASDGR